MKTVHIASALTLASSVMLLAVCAPACGGQLHRVPELGKRIRRWGRQRWRERRERKRWEFFPVGGDGGTATTSSAPAEDRRRSAASAP